MIQGFLRLKMQLALLFTVSLFGGCGRLSAPASKSKEKKAEAKADGKERPFLAIWRQDDGYRGDSEAPYLRISIWNDGRILFAKDPSKWGHSLRQGRISAGRVVRLKKALLATGVFDLKGYCYLVPDAPCDCVMLDLGDKKQILYWDEVETPGYGINHAPKPYHLKFKECWKAVNKLALEARPEKSKEVKDRFQSPPAHWFLKKPIQSK
jgi:hypothetical protein